MQLNYEPRSFLGFTTNMWSTSFTLHDDKRLQKIGRGSAADKDLSRDMSVKTDLVAMIYRGVEEDNCCDFVVVKLLELGVNKALVVSEESIGVVGDEVDVSVLLPFGRDGFSLNIKAVVDNMCCTAIQGGNFQMIYGLKFKHVSNEDLMLIKSYISIN